MSHCCSNSNVFDILQSMRYKMLSCLYYITFYVSYMCTNLHGKSSSSQIRNCFSKLFEWSEPEGGQAARTTISNFEVPHEQHCILPLQLSATLRAVALDRQIRKQHARQLNYRMVAQNLKSKTNANKCNK